MNDITLDTHFSAYFNDIENNYELEYDNGYVFRNTFTIIVWVYSNENVSDV